jgi:hypothetical protein
MDFLNGTWVKKYRRSLLVAAGLVGAGVVMYYGVRSLSLTAQARVEKDAARSLLLQKEAEDRAEAQFQSHFESIQRISDSTTLPSVLPHLKARLFALVDLSGLTEKLILGKEDPQALSSRDKMQLWQELKTLSVFPSQLSVRLHTHTSINPLFSFNLPRIPFEQTLMSTVSYESCLFFKLGRCTVWQKVMARTSDASAAPSRL